MTKAYTSLVFALGLVGLTSTTTVAQSTPSHIPCGTDTAVAELYGSWLQQMHTQGAASARVEWAPPSSELCSAAQHAPIALISDSGGAGNSDQVLYVYAVTGLNSVRYVVVTYSPRRSKVSEWPGTVCFFDEYWKPHGACLAS